MATAILTEATLVDQPEKTQLEYRVIAVNKAGEGQTSNTGDSSVMREKYKKGK